MIKKEENKSAKKMVHVTKGACMKKKTIIPNEMAC